MEVHREARGPSMRRGVLAAGVLGMLPLAVAAWTLLISPPAEASAWQLAWLLVAVALASGIAGLVFVPAWRWGLVASLPLALALGIGLLLAALSPAHEAALAAFAVLLGVPIMGGLAGLGGAAIRAPLRRRVARWES